MPLADKDFPSSKAFDLIDQVLQDEETRKDMMKSANAIFGFDLTSPDGSKQVREIKVMKSGADLLTIRKAGTSTSKTKAKSEKATKTQMFDSS